ncbi:hypothetical protein [Leifsonia poae]|uniref:Uncharacterized protein n=1 Tax=Leifsonia poae TaxID=110933 RepID=A0A9W6LYS6_9MICO|nr:hypothetical protein [Leifsonia poae]GLJ75150.1 hypothetical protein GCM10017584_07230 [Leifsonia poae]
MKIVLDRVAKGARNAALPPTSASFQTGEVTLARAETEQRPTVLGLIASGRMRPDAGTVTIDGSADYSAMRKRIALIDAPDVCEPAPDVTVAGIVAEELMFAGRASNPIAVNRALNELGVSEFARYAIGTIPPTVRIRLLAELALMRDGVEGLVITSPDRHGGDPNEWWELARRLAARDIAILIVAGDASAAAIAASSLVARLDDATTPRTLAARVEPAADEAAEAAEADDADRAAADTFDEDPGRDDTDELPDLIVAPAHSGATLADIALTESELHATALAEDPE